MEKEKHHNSPNELLSLPDRMKYAEFIEDLAYLEESIPFYAVIGVEDEVLGERILQNLKTHSENIQTAYDVPFDIRHIDYLKACSTAQSLCVLPIFGKHQPEENAETVAARLLFNRDVVAEESLQLVWILSASYYDALLKTAYDFSSAANFTHYFRNSAAQTQKDLAPPPLTPKIKYATKKRKKN